MSSTPEVPTPVKEKPAVQTLKISDKLVAKLAAYNNQVKQAQGMIQEIINTVFECSEYAGKDCHVIKVENGSISFIIPNSVAPTAPQLVKEDKKE